MHEQNFVISILDAQFVDSLASTDDSTSQFIQIDNIVNVLFTFAFLIELIFNIFANWRSRFIYNGWNWFDVLIVSISMVDFAISNIPNWLVKLMRACRVIRLFGRVEALKKMITAVSASIFPMMNAFVILLIVLGICE